jgi:hypothetical protein
VGEGRGVGKPYGMVFFVGFFSGLVFVLFFVGFARSIDGTPIYATYLSIYPSTTVRVLDLTIFGVASSEPLVSRSEAPKPGAAIVFRFRRAIHWVYLDIVEIVPSRLSVLSVYLSRAALMRYAQRAREMSCVLLYVVFFSAASVRRQATARLDNASASEGDGLIAVEHEIGQIPHARVLVRKGSCVKPFYESESV